MATSVASGVAFGAALVAAGVHHPSTILAQLRLDNFHMLQSFLTGAATSGVIVSVLQYAEITKFPPRKCSSLGLFATFDANILGGLLLGAGMAISGACPGTVLAQIGAGVPSGLPAFAGALLAGTVWSAFLKNQLPFHTWKLKKGDDTPLTTLDEFLGVQPLAATAGLQAIFYAVVLSLILVGQKPMGGLVPPAVGGLLIGIAQLVSITLRGSLLGASIIYEETAQLFRSTLGAKKPQTQSILFGLGIMVGARALTIVYPDPNTVVPTGLPVAHSVVGGFLVVIGARISGGCPSGHGISGSSLLSISSLITTMAMLGGGVLVRKMLDL